MVKKVFEIWVRNVSEDGTEVISVFKPLNAEINIDNGLTTGRRKFNIEWEEYHTVFPDIIKRDKRLKNTSKIIKDIMKRNDLKW